MIRKQRQTRQLARIANRQASRVAAQQGQLQNAQTRLNARAANRASIQGRRDNRVERNQDRLDKNADARNIRKERFSEEGRGLQFAQTLAPYIPAFVEGLDTTVRGGLDLAKLLNPEAAAASGLADLSNSYLSGSKTSSGGGSNALSLNNSQPYSSGYEDYQYVDGYRDDPNQKLLGYNGNDVTDDPYESATSNFPSSDNGSNAYGSSSNDSRTSMNFIPEKYSQYASTNPFAQQSPNLEQQLRQKQQEQTYQQAVNTLAAVTQHRPIDVLHTLAQNGLQFAFNNAFN